MKDILIAELRDEKSTRSQFRNATQRVGQILALKASEHLEKESYKLQTPLTEAQGHRLKNNTVLIPILRSGLSLLAPFLEYFPNSAVGLLGLRRDEKTAIPHLYYSNLPQIWPDDDILILEPMLATGNTISMVIDILIKNVGVNPSKIILCSIVAAPEGIEKIKKLVPLTKIIVIQEDESLNNQKFIVPGLGDFGDRYFGTEK